MIHPSIVNGSDNGRICVCLSFGTSTCSCDAKIVHCLAGCTALLGSLASDLAAAGSRLRFCCVSARVTFTVGWDGSLSGPRPRLLRCGGSRELDAGSVATLIVPAAESSAALATTGCAALSSMKWSGSKVRGMNWKSMSQRPQFWPTPVEADRKGVSLCRMGLQNSLRSLVTAM